ncbi:hypothetical protein FRC06_011804 [Ceratobasidium sp. 370]|nr:hypothetical protein FRC06_011804 [Ceratobasidium sp. 370]
MVRSESLSRGREDGIAGEERGREILPASRVTHSGRGGAGNIRSPSRDPESDIRELSREHEIIETHRKSEEGQIHSTGRGGFGNMERSRSRSREPNKVLHSSGRGGFGNIVNGDGHSLADLEEEGRVQHIHVPEFHSSGRGGAGNISPGGPPAAESPHAPISSDAHWRSSGRGGAGNIVAVQHKDPAAATEEGRGRNQHSTLGGFIDRLTSRSRDPPHRDN